MPTDAERYNLLLQALATGIEDIRQAFEMAFGVVVIDDKPTTRTHFVDRHMDERRQKHP